MDVTRLVLKQLSEKMRCLGFHRKKRCFYYERNNIAFCIELEVPSSSLYVNYFVMPLFIPSKYRYCTYGRRLNSLPDANIPSICQDASTAEIEKWLQNLYRCLEIRILPFFRSISTPKDLVNFTQCEQQEIFSYFFCTSVDIYRLLLHSYYYLGELSQATGIIGIYKEIICQSSYLTDRIKQTYFEEAKKLSELASGSKECLSKYFSEVVDSTRIACF